MHRECSHCHRPFTAGDFGRAESKGMEADRRALGLPGVRFLYYDCPACGGADIFLDLHRLPGEAQEDYQARRQELEGLVRRRGGDVEAVLCER
jgi:hypothetical protein